MKKIWGRLAIHSKNDNYVNLTVLISAIYVATLFLIGDQLSFLKNQKPLLWITALLTSINIGLLSYLFCKGRLTFNIILLNFIQFAIFCQLHIQIYNILGADNYSCSSLPHLSDWGKFLTIHVLKILDLPDLIEAYDIITFQKLSHKGIASGIALFAMYFMIGTLILGVIFRLVPHLSRIEVSPAVKKWFIYTGLSSTLLMIVIAGWKNQNFMTGWHLWPLGNILCLMDFADALQLFGWQFHNLETDASPPAVRVFFRATFGAWFIIQMYHLYSYILEEALRKRIGEISAIVRSVEYPPEVRITAIEKLQEYGKYAEPAIPALVEVLVNYHVNIRRASADALRKIKPKWAWTQAAQEFIPEFSRLLEKADKGTRIATAEALGKFGAYAKEAVPVLVKVLADDYEDKKVLDTTEQTLTKIGAAAIPKLAEIMRDTDEAEKNRDAAAHAMTQITACDSEKSVGIKNEYERIRGKAVRVLSEMLDSNDEKTRTLASEVLKSIGADAVPVLIQMLRADSLPSLIIRALEKIGPVAKHLAFSYLIKFLSKKPNKKFRKKLIEVMEGMALSRNSGRTNLSRNKRANDLHQDKRESLSEKLIGHVKSLKDEQSKRRVLAAKALGEIGPPAGEAIPDLVSALQDKNKKVRTSAEKALHKIILPPIPSLSILVKNLTKGENSDRIDSAIILGELGARAKKSIPYLVKALADADQTVRTEAARALGKIDFEWQKHECLDILIPSFIKAMGGLFDDEFHCDMPREALKKVEPVRYLVESLIHYNYDVRRNSAEFLETYHPEWRQSEDALKAIPFLVEGLKSDDWYIRKAAAKILGEFGWQAKGSVPDLLKAMAGTDREVRQAIKNALANILLRNKNKDKKKGKKK